MSIWTYAANHAGLFMLVLLRVAAALGASPLWSLRVWPVWTRAALACALALWITPALPAVQVPNPLLQPDAFIGLALRETAVGLLLGWTASAWYAAAAMAGQVFDLQMGLAVGAVYEALWASPLGVSGTLMTVLFSLYFLTMGGLDGWVLAVQRSYAFVGLGAWHMPPGAPGWLAHLAGLAMLAAVQITAPLLAALLLTDVTLALLARAVPHMNAFVTGLPAKLFVGLSVFAAAVPAVVFALGRVFQGMFQALDAVLRWLGG